MKIFLVIRTLYKNLWLINKRAREEKRDTNPTKRLEERGVESRQMLLFFKYGITENMDQILINFVHILEAFIE